MAKRHASTPPRLQPPRRPELDDLDWKLLARLQADARVTTADLAREFKLSAPGVQKRVRRLEEKGVVRHHATVLNREAVGLDLLCFILIMLAHHRADSVQRFQAGVNAMPEVLECHYLTGEFDCLVKVVVGNHEELQRFLERLMKVGAVDRLRTAIVLQEIKSTTSLPLPGNSL
jgi:Lrp/AsnC family transcriptional regulator, leucine-responsive regulatory protein